RAADARLRPGLRCRGSGRRAVRRGRLREPRRRRPRWAKLDLEGLAMSGARYCTALVALGSLLLAVGANAQGGAEGARSRAPLDLQGQWVSVVTEDWRWRMTMPPKGDYASVPLNDAGIAAANQWQPARAESEPP